MTIEGAFTQIAWLQNNYIKQYPMNLSEERIKGMAEQFMDSYGTYTDAEVMEAYKYFLNERKEPPVISEVRSRLVYQRNSKVDPLEQAITQKTLQRYEKPDEIVYRTGIPGRMMHRQAISHFLQDYAAGDIKGGSEYYYRAFPEVEFVPIGADLRGG